MSALGIIITTRQAHLITDGAAGADGVLMCSSVKVQAMPHLGVAVAFRGPMLLMPSLFVGVAAARDIHDLLSDFEAGIRRFMMSSAYLDNPGNFEIAIAGVMDRKPFGYILSTFDRPGIPALKLCPITALFCSPPVPDEVMHLAFERAQSNSPADLRISARALVDEQRKSRESVVGAFAQVTSVGDAGSFTFLAHRYADEFGKRLALDT